MKGAIVLVALVALLGLASGSNANLDEKQASFCQGCRSLISFSQRFNSSSDRAEYKELAKNYCELFYPVSTDYQQGPCPMFVEALYYVLDHTDAVNHCDQIGACDQKADQEQPSDDIYEYLQGTLAKSVASSSSSNTIKSKSDNVVCEFCESMVKQVQDSLSQAEVIDTVRSQLESVCEYLKVIDEEKQCRQLLDSYLDQAIDFIRQINPKQYCQSIQLCTSSQQLTPHRLSPMAGNEEQQQLPTLADFRNFGLETSVTIGKLAVPAAGTSEDIEKPEAKRGTPTCMLCQLIVKEMFKFLRNNRTEANIELGLERVCHTIFHDGAKREQCDSMVKAYTRELVQLLQDETDPEMICMLLGECVSASEELKMLSTRSPIQSVVEPIKPVKTISMGELITAFEPKVELRSARACLECKLFIKFLKEQLQEPQSQQEVEQWVKTNVCERLPDPQLVSSCEAMIHKEAPILIEAVIGQLDPHIACHQLGVCQSFRRTVTVFNLLGNTQSLASPRPLFGQAKKDVHQVTNGIVSSMCDQCIEIVTQIDDYLSNHPIDQDVSVLIDKVCNKLPEGTVRGECTYIIKMFGASIVQAIESMDNPRQLCSKIYLCQA